MDFPKYFPKKVEVFNNLELNDPMVKNIKNTYFHKKRYRLARELVEYGIKQKDFSFLEVLRIFTSFQEDEKSDESDKIIEDMIIDKVFKECTINNKFTLAAHFIKGLGCKLKNLEPAILEKINKLVLNTRRAGDIYAYYKSMFEEHPPASGSLTYRKAFLWSSNKYGINGLHNLLLKKLKSQI